MELLKVDVEDTEFRSLTHLAGRIATLLDNPVVSSNTDLFSTLDDFLGAVYALIFARRGGFKERRGHTPEPEPPRIRARQLEKGEVRVDGAWMAGFHFNSALYRIAAVYHRVLKLAASSQCLQRRKRPMVGDLLLDVERCFANWTGRAWVHPNLSAVHNEVNLLKHEREGIYTTRGVGFNEGVSAADELLQLIEAWINDTSKAKQLAP
jgi:hypothetical protein